MKRRNYLIIVLLVGCTLGYSASSPAQPTLVSSPAKVGGFKLPAHAYGLFGTAAHVNNDSSFTNYVNYATRFALWVGGVTEKGEIRVTAGTGNAKTYRPEWSPVRHSFQSSIGSANVKRVISLSYSDVIPFQGHTPLGVRVDQEAREFLNSGFAILNFTITLDSTAAPLSQVYVGFFADIDAPDATNVKSAGNDLVATAANGSAPYIFDGFTAGSKVPVLGATILGVAAPIVSSWPADADPVGDRAEYDCLQGKGAGGTPGESGDVRFLLSYGPLSLRPGETVDFPVALVQAAGVAAFESSLANARQFFSEQMRVPSLMSKLSGSPQVQTSFDATPEDFRLYSNYPNPFNPTTAIQFDLPEAVHVRVQIYNSLGQRVRTVVDQDYSAGSFEVVWNGRDDMGRELPSGVYVYRITAGDFQAQKKLLLLK